MNKAFRTLVDDGTEVTIDTGLRAAEKLQAVLDGRERGTDVAKIMVQVNHIIEAVRSTVPQEMWGEIKRKLNEAEQHSEPVGMRRKPSTKLMTSSIPPNSRRRTTSLTPITARLSR